MTAYHDDAALKAKYVERARSHREADDLIQGYGYWCPNSDGEMKGCAIGCLAEADEDAHEALEEQTGLPASLNHIADTIFEGLPDPDYKTWPERYVSSARVGANLSNVHHRFFAWLLTDFLRSSLTVETWGEIGSICEAVAELHRREAEGETVPWQQWAAARDAARDAACDAAWAARAAAWKKMADKLVELMAAA